MPPRALRFVLWIAGALLLGLILWRACGQPEPVPADGMRDTTRAVNERLDSSAATFQQKKQAGKVAAAQHRERSNSAKTAADIAKGQANAEAEAAERATTAADSAAHWKAAFLLQKVRADSLDSALVAERRSHQETAGRAFRAEARVDTLETARQLLRDDLKERTSQLLAARRRTKTAFVGGITVGTVVTILVVNAAKD